MMRREHRTQRRSRPLPNPPNQPLGLKIFPVHSGFGNEPTIMFYGETSRKKLALFVSGVFV